MRSSQQAAMRNPLAIVAPLQKRTFIKDLGLDVDSVVARNQAGEHTNLELWKQQVEAQEKGLILKSDDEIEQYVISIVKDYFRTTRKASVTLDSLFADHGLDSLDAIELVIRVEDELGYLIDAENLELFKKPRHFVNFIKQMEAYKEEFNRLPNENTKYAYNFREAFPGLPGGKWETTHSLW